MDRRSRRVFLHFMEYESMELDLDLQRIVFRNVRLLPQHPLLVTDADYHDIVWPFANFYFGSTPNLALMSRDGLVIRRMTIHRPCLTTIGNPPRTTTEEDDPIEEWED